jgi:hypothetical protein
MLTATFRLLSRATALAGFERMAIEEHGASGWPSFAEKAKKLIDQDQVPMVLGGWASVSRRQCCRCLRPGMLQNHLHQRSRPRSTSGTRH